MNILCTTQLAASLPELKQFQGDLKKRTAADIDALIASLKTDGLLMPFVIWNDAGTFKLLDGHARLEALVKMAIDDPAILTMPLPYLELVCKDEDEAKKALLQITSSYGTVTKKGLAHFTASIASYTSPAPIVVKTMAAKAAPVTQKAADEVIMRLRVRKDVLERFSSIVANVDGVTVV